MNRTARDKRQNLPKPVQRMEISDSHAKRNIILICIFATIAVCAMVYFLYTLLSGNSGWQEIKVSPGVASCAGDVTLHYDIGSGEDSARAEYKKLYSLYETGVIKAYRLFDAEETYTSMNNLASLNRQPNQTLEVDAALYNALQLLQDSGSRYLYFGPLSWEYRALFCCEEDAYAAEIDPLRSAAAKDYFAKVAAFAADPAHVQVQLLGENRVCLQVSDEYLQFAEQAELPLFIDMGRLRNAFAVDYLAELLQENGLTHGMLNTVDGFSRTLDDRDPFRYSIIACTNNTVYSAGEVAYRGPRSFVWLHDYPVQSDSSSQYYVYADGTIVTDYLDMTDGVSRTARHELLCSSAEKSCAQLLLEALPAYATASWDANALQPQTDLVLCEGDTLYYRGDGLAPASVYADDAITFQFKAFDAN